MMLISSNRSAISLKNAAFLQLRNISHHPALFFEVLCNLSQSNPSAFKVK
jgi:hypothetical protein